MYYILTIVLVIVKLYVCKSFYDRTIWPTVNGCNRTIAHPAQPKAEPLQFCKNAQASLSQACPRTPPASARTHAVGPLQAPAANGACSGKVGTVVNKCTGPCTAGERRAYSGIFARRLQPFTAVCVVCRAEPECPMQFCTAAQPRGVGQAVD